MSEYRQIYLDTNILIALNEGESEISTLLSRVIASSTEIDRALFVTSAVTFSEVLVRPYREMNHQLVRTYQDWSRSTTWLKVETVTRGVLDFAAILRAARPNLKLPDAIHLATALGAGCSHFLSGDMRLHSIERLDHPLYGPVDIQPLSVIRPDEPTLTSLLQSLIP